MLFGFSISENMAILKFHAHSSSDLGQFYTLYFDILRPFYMFNMNWIRLILLSINQNYIRYAVYTVYCAILYTHHDTRERTRDRNKMWACRPQPIRKISFPIIAFLLLGSPDAIRQRAEWAYKRNLKCYYCRKVESTFQSCVWTLDTMLWVSHLPPPWNGEMWKCSSCSASAFVMA